MEPKFYIKQPIDIRILEGAFRGRYKSVIMNLTDEILYLQVPRISDIFVPIDIGIQFFIRYYEKDKAYEALTIVKERDDTVIPPLLSVAKPNFVKEIQIREYQRVSADSELKFRIETEEELSAIAYKEELLTGKIVDISAGGMKFLSPIEIPENTVINLTFELNLIDKKFENIKLKVLKNLENDEHKIYIVGEFINLTEQQKHNLTSYVVKKIAALKNQIK